MRRVVSVWLPTWPTDRLRRRKPGIASPDEPLVTGRHDGHRQIVAAVDKAARNVGLFPSMPLARAQAMIPGLVIEPADEAGDAAALGEAAAWCLRYAPLTAPDPPDGIWIDASGCAHLHGGEAVMLGDLAGRFAANGITARVAIADTPGAAWAIARHAPVASRVVMPDETAAAVRALAVSALRLPEEITRTLRRLGLERIGPLLDAPRGPLALRFGADLVRRLDQITGRVFEPIEPVFPVETITHRLAFIEPLLTAESFAGVIAALVDAACIELERRGEGARQVDLVFERVDGTRHVVRVGTARPVRDAAHLARLLDERIDQVDPGLGVEAMRLVVPLADALNPTQRRVSLLGSADEDEDIGVLVDRLINRLGVQRVYRAVPVESDVPERSVSRVSPMAAPAGRTWPPSLPRPSRLLTPPQPIETMAMLPDHPPALFVWRRKPHRVRRADGPERIAGEWWRREGERSAIRDYWQVEDEQGRRFWLYRSGDGVDPATGDLRWFLHGFF